MVGWIENAEPTDTKGQPAFTMGTLVITNAPYSRACMIPRERQHLIESEFIEI